MQEMTKPSLMNCHRPAPGRPSSAGLRSFWTLLEKWYAREMERRQLKELECHMLDDIGMTCGQMRRETAKPFWRQ